MMAQQLAIQHANAAAQATSNVGQPNQMAPQQLQNLQNAQMQAAQQHQQQQQQAAAATQQSQPPGQIQPQAPQAQQPQPQPQTPQQQPAQQQQQVAASAMMQQRPRDQIRGHCILKLVQFGDHLSQFVVSSKPIEFYMSRGAQILDAQATKQREDLAYWIDFVETFFSPRGVLRHSVWDIDENSSKQYEVTFPALARYFFTHFESGIINMQMIAEKAKDKELPNNCHYIESQKSSFIYWFDNGSQVCCPSWHRKDRLSFNGQCSIAHSHMYRAHKSQLVANGTLRAQFDSNQKIELLEFVTSNHEEYVRRRGVLEAARPLHEWQKEWQKANPPLDGKQSPEMSKKKPRPMKSPPTAPPDIDLPDTKVKGGMGITPAVFRFLEVNQA
jgi:hypothetical protein